MNFNLLKEKIIMQKKEIGSYLVTDPEICHGKLIFKGTRVPVSTVLTFLAMGDSIQDILRNWPQLKREYVEEAINFASDLITESYPSQRVAV